MANRYPDYFDAVDPRDLGPECAGDGCVSDGVHLADNGSHYCDRCRKAAGLSTCVDCEEIETVAVGLDGLPVCSTCQSARTLAAGLEMAAAFAGYVDAASRANRAFAEVVEAHFGGGKV